MRSRESVRAKEKIFRRSSAGREKRGLWDWGLTGSVRSSILGIS